MRKDYNLEKRKLVIGGFIVAIVIIYIVRLVQLQVMDSTYKANADNNAFIALEQIHQASDDKLLYYIPTVVNGAFSTEITLKAILANNDIEYGKEHNLLALFQLLPDSFAMELLGDLYKKAPPHKRGMLYKNHSFV